MAPSRGLASLRHSRIKFNIYCSRYSSNLARVATDKAAKTQIYVSRTLDPYLNLSIEHFLLQKSPPESTILFLYTNRPCIVIGRNQNPWVEVNLGLLNTKSQDDRLHDIESISLVRRRSGGGTVFHDEGNVNYSVICPTAAFDRDKHAQMVVRALNRLGVERAKINERHDIVLKQDSEQNHGSTIESTSTSISSPQAARKPLKVSGSAYKLTRLRSLHHGTCLLSSPNVQQISQYLRSPAKPYIKARGVDSVSSPIANVNVSNGAFESAVMEEFGRMYGSVEPHILTDEATKIPEVAKGLAEMRSLEWIYMQTPQFTFSSHLTDHDPRKRPPLPDYFPPGVTFSFTARNGTIIETELAVFRGGDSSGKKTLFDTSALVQQRVHAIGDWQEVIPEPLIDDKFSVSRWLNELFGNGLR